MVGSANLERRALVLNDEGGAVVRDPAGIGEGNARIDGWAKESTRYTEDLYRRSRTWLGQTVETVSHVVAPLL